MDLRVEYYFDADAQHWGFRIPSLRIVGGGQDSKEEAEEAARQAILFTLEADEQSATPTQCAQVGHFRITVEKAS